MSLRYALLSLSNLVGNAGRSVAENALAEDWEDAAASPLSDSGADSAESGGRGEDGRGFVYG